jgi:heme A synthase
MMRNIGSAALLTAITVIAALVLGSWRGKSALLANLQERPLLALIHVTAAFVVYLLMFLYLERLRKR